MAERLRVQVLGLCRFSYPAALGGFKTKHASMEERLADLYSEDRMLTRLFWFEHVALPGIREQSRDDFTLIVLIGEEMPARWRARLEALIAPIPTIKLVARPSGPHREVYREVMFSHRDAEADVVAEFRLDDDDAVSVNYVKSIRRNFRQLRVLFGQTGRLALDQGKGILITADGPKISYEALLTHCWAAGLTIFMHPDDEHCVTDFPHQKVWQRMLLVSHISRTMFLRGAHSTNDSAVTSRGTAPAHSDPGTVPELLRHRFGVDQERFESGWEKLALRLKL